MGGMSLGQKIRFQREVLGLTQAELADKVGVYKGTIGCYEWGRTVPRADDIRCKLAKALEMPYDKLYGDTVEEVLVDSDEPMGIGIDFRNLRRSFGEIDEMQLEAWRCTFKYLLANVDTLTHDDRMGIDGCMDEIERLQREKKQAKRADRRWGSARNKL